MSQYFLQIGETLATVLENAHRAQPEILAGYVANFDFWTAEFRHLLDVSNGYDDRLESMKRAVDDYVSIHGGLHNRDDTCTPYQRVVKTSTRQDREAVVERCRTAMERLIQRAYRFKLIRLERHDDLLEQIHGRLDKRSTTDN